MCVWTAHGHSGSNWAVSSPHYRRCFGSISSPRRAPGALQVDSECLATIFRPAANATASLAGRGRKRKPVPGSHHRAHISPSSTPMLGKTSAYLHSISFAPPMQFNIFPSPRELSSGWIRRTRGNSSLDCDNGLTVSRFLNWSITYLSALDRYMWQSSSIYPPVSKHHSPASS